MYHWFGLYRLGLKLAGSLHQLALLALPILTAVQLILHFTFKS